MAFGSDPGLSSLAGCNCTDRTIAGHTADSDRSCCTVGHHNSGNSAGRRSVRLGCIRLGCIRTGRNLDYRSLGCYSLGYCSLGCRSLGYRSLGCRNLGCHSLNFHNLGCIADCTTVGRIAGCRIVGTAGPGFSHRTVNRLDSIAVADRLGHRRQGNVSLRRGLGPGLDLVLGLFLGEREWFL